jgi:hypothetical protein
MVTFNYFKLRTTEDGKTFLDLEVTLTWHPQRLIMQYSFPATADYLNLLPIIGTDDVAQPTGSNDSCKP